MGSVITFDPTKDKLAPHGSGPWTVVNPDNERQVKRFPSRLAAVDYLADVTPPWADWELEYLPAARTIIVETKTPAKTERKQTAVALKAQVEKVSRNA